MNAFIEENKLMLIGGAVALVALIILVKKKGAAAAVGAAVGKAAIDAATGVATGTVDAVGQTAGLPALKDEIDDPAQCRAGIDANGQIWGMGHCTASAYLKALTMSSAPAPTAQAQVTNDLSAVDPVENSDLGINFNSF